MLQSEQLYKVVDSADSADNYKTLEITIENIIKNAKKLNFLSDHHKDGGMLRFITDCYKNENCWWLC